MSLRLKKSSSHHYSEDFTEYPAFKSEWNLKQICGSCAPGSTLYLVCYFLSFTTSLHLLSFFLSFIHFSRRSFNFSFLFSLFLNPILFRYDTLNSCTKRSSDFFYSRSFLENTFDVYLFLNRGERDISF